MNMITQNLKFLIFLYMNEWIWSSMLFYNLSQLLGGDLWWYNGEREGHWTWYRIKFVSKVAMAILRYCLYIVLDSLMRKVFNDDDDDDNDEDNNNKKHLEPCQSG